MKKLLSTVIVLALILAGLFYLFRDQLQYMAEESMTSNMFVSAEAATFNPGPRIGSDFPGVQASYRGRNVTLLEEFTGGNGVILIALRSVDWCPFCKKQLIQLQETHPLFEANGIGLVAITYDDPALQDAFSEEHSIRIPILSDNQALSFKTLGILHPDYQPGDENYGIPHPGLIILDREGEVVGKLFVEDPYLRVDSKEVLRHAKKVLGVEGPL